MKKIIFLALVLCPVLRLGADSLPFRSGIILAAELSSAEQKISDFDEADYPDLPRQNRIYAAVTLTLFPGRALSRHDYVLSAFGNDARCVAIRTGDGPWKCLSGDIDIAEKGKKYGMLFILDSRVAGLNPTEKLGLKCCYPPEKHATTGLVFRNCRDRALTPASQVPSGGILAPQK